MNLTVIDGDNELLIREMRARGDEVESVVLTNSRDISLLSPKPRSDLMRTKIGEDLVLEVEVNPTEIPSDREGEIVRLKITLKNSGKDELKDLALTDLILPARMVAWWSSASGKVVLTDPSTGLSPTPDSAFFSGTNLSWTIDRLGPREFATLNLEVLILHALDAGWTQALDGGISVNYTGKEEEGRDGRERARIDDGPFINITRPSRASPGWTTISWEVTRQPARVVLNYYNPEGEKSSQVFTDSRPGKVSNATLLLGRPGTWTFNLEAWSASETVDHKTENFTVTVATTASPMKDTPPASTKYRRYAVPEVQM